MSSQERETYVVDLSDCSPIGLKQYLFLVFLRNLIASAGLSNASHGATCSPHLAMNSRPKSRSSSRVSARVESPMVGTSNRASSASPPIPVVSKTTRSYFEN